MTSKTLVLGSNGQLGQCIKAIGNSDITELIFPDEAEADILDIDSLDRLFSKERPQYVVNCAAYTAVDKSEDEVDLARRVNRDGASNIAGLCKKYDATIIHISTDFVFEGISVLPQTEGSPTQPINVYGLTKLEGETAISDLTNRYFILRTSWLYSEYGSNFVKTMLRLGVEKPELRVIADQFGSPTYAMDLARTILGIIRRKSSSYGLYHYSNLGIATWFDFAKAIFELSGIKTKLIPIPTSEFITKAQRPHFSIMDKSKIENTFELKIPNWHDSLRECLAKINK